MLPYKHRLTSPTDFSRVTKSGIRVGSGNLFLYLYSTNEELPARAGLIISKVVGGSVVRHRIARKLRHALADELPKLPHGTLLVVRTLAGAKQADLRDEISILIKKAEAKVVATAR